MYLDERKGMLGGWWMSGLIGVGLEELLLVRMKRWCVMDGGMGYGGDGQSGCQVKR